MCYKCWIPNHCWRCAMPLGASHRYYCSSPHSMVVEEDCKNETKVVNGKPLSQGLIQPTAEGCWHPNGIPTAEEEKIASARRRNIDKKFGI